MLTNISLWSLDLIYYLNDISNPPENSDTSQIGLELVHNELAYPPFRVYSLFLLFIADAVLPTVVFVFARPTDGCHHCVETLDN